MPAPDLVPYEYAMIRAVPRVERGEFINIGIIVLCLSRKTLLCRIHIDETRLEALWPGADMPALQAHAQAVQAICEGQSEAGAIAQLTARERFHWLVAPRSAIIQTSPAHTGVCDPATLPHLANHLFDSLVSFPD